MRIVFLAHRVPYPPDKGDKIRAFQELRSLAERGHHVHLLAFADDPADLRHEAALAPLCASVVLLPLRRSVAMIKAALAGLTGAPLSLGFFGASAMRRHVAEALRTWSPDVVVAYSSTMAQFVPGELAKHAVLDLVDADSEKWHEYAQHVRAPRSWLYRLEYRRLRAYERSLIDRVALSIVTTEREAALLDPQRRRSRQVRALTNGVDLGYFSPRADAAEAEARDERRIVFTGTMDYYPNVDAVTYFAEHVLPRVRAADPTVEFVIVGHKPTPRVTRLATMRGVQVTGSVPDIRPYLSQATVCVAPLRIARGVQNKIFEAMAMQRAIVASSAAIAGLDVTPGRQLLVADTSEEQAAAIVSVIQDKELRARLGARARQFVEEKHRWSSMRGQFVGLVESVAKPSLASLQAELSS